MPRSLLTWLILFCHLGCSSLCRDKSAVAAVSPVQPPLASCRPALATSFQQTLVSTGLLDSIISLSLAANSTHELEGIMGIMATVLFSHFGVSTPTTTSPSSPSFSTFVGKEIHKLLQQAQLERDQSSTCTIPTSELVLNEWRKRWEGSCNTLAQMTGLKKRTVMSRVPSSSVVVIEQPNKSVMIGLTERTLNSSSSNINEPNLVFENNSQSDSNDIEAFTIEMPPNAEYVDREERRRDHEEQTALVEARWLALHQEMEASIQHLTLCLVKPLIVLSLTWLFVVLFRDALPF